MELPKVHSEQAAMVAAKAAQKADFADRMKTAIERKGTTSKVAPSHCTGISKP